MEMQYNREPKQRNVVRTINCATAAEAVGEIYPGCEIFGMFKGQFSLIELIEWILVQTGPASLVVSTWTAASGDILHLRHLIENGDIIQAKWMLDASFPHRQPGFAEMICEKFGQDNVRFTSNHSKFVLFRNAKWNIVLRTTANLNNNRRLESYEISDDQNLLGFLAKIAKSTFEEGATLDECFDHPKAAFLTIDNVCGLTQYRQQEILFNENPPERLVSYAQPKNIRYGGGRNG